MQAISSKDNEIIKSIRKLKDKKYRDIENAYIIEGIKLLKEAIAEKADIKQIIICDDCEKTEEISKELCTFENKNYKEIKSRFIYSFLIFIICSFKLKDLLQ